MAKQKLTKELIEQNLVALNNQAPSVQANAMLEAGKAIGRVEGQVALLKQLAELVGQDEVDEAPPKLKLADADAPGDEEEG